MNMYFREDAFPCGACIAFLFCVCYPVCPVARVYPGKYQVFFYSIIQSGLGLAFLSRLGFGTLAARPLAAKSPQSCHLHVKTASFSCFSGSKRCTRVCRSVRKYRLLRVRNYVNTEPTVYIQPGTKFNGGGGYTARARPVRSHHIQRTATRKKLKEALLKLLKDDSTRR